MATSKGCPKHESQELQPVCDSSDELPCGTAGSRTDNDGNATCTTTGEGTHKIELLTNVVKDEKRRIREALSESDRLEHSAVESLEDLTEREGALVTQEEQAKDSIRQMFTHLKGMFDQREEALMTGVDDFIRQEKESITKGKQDVAHFLENLQKTKEEAETLISNSEDGYVHRMFPSISDRLTTPWSITPPIFRTVKFIASEEMSSLSDLAKRAGSLQIVQPPQANELAAAAAEPTIHVVHKKGCRLKPDSNGFREIPQDICMIDSPAGPVLVEAFTYSGLYTASSSGEKTEISKQIREAGDPVNCFSACTSPDGKKLYSPTLVYGDKVNKRYHPILVYTVSEGQLRLSSEVYVDGAQELCSIKAASSTGRLVVIECSTSGIMRPLGRRILLLSPQMELLREIGQKLTNKDTQGEPRGVEWSQDEKSIYIGCRRDSHQSGGPHSVIKMQIEPTEAVIWRAYTEHIPLQITLINNLLYVTYSRHPQMTVFSEADGSVTRTVECQGPVRGVWQTQEGSIEVMWYRKRATD